MDTVTHNTQYEHCNSRKYNVACRYVFAKFGLLPSENDNLRLFEDGVLRWLFGFKREGVAGEGRNLNSRGLHSPTCGQNIIRVMTSLKTMRSGHMPCLVERGKVHSVAVEKH